MLSLPPSVRLFVAREATDMRKSFDTLAALVIEVVEQDPQSGHLFLFVNRRRDRLKVLWWDRSGYCLLAKRLEHGQFRVFDRADGTRGAFEMSASELTLILEGIECARSFHLIRRRRSTTIADERSGW
jgi:transposase